MKIRYLLKITLAACFSFCMMASVVVAQNETIEPFDGSVEEAFQYADINCKAILIYLYGDYCMPCRKMKDSVFTHNDVSAYYNSYFVNVFINLSKTEPPNFLKEHGIDYVPTMLFFNRTGSLMEKHVGGISVDTMMLIGAEVTQDVREIGCLPQTVRIMKMQKLRTEAYRGKRAQKTDNKIVKNYLDLVRADEWESKINRQFLLDFFDDFDNGAVEHFLRQLNYYKGTVPDLNDRILNAAWKNTNKARVSQDGKLMQKVEDVIQEADLPDAHLTIKDMKELYDNRYYKKED